VEAREQAVERGMLIISPDNFMVVTGFRRTNDDGGRETLTFSPQRPAGGTPTTTEPVPPAKKDQ
jgi:hypothetical protein